MTAILDTVRRGLDVLRQIRADEWTRPALVVIRAPSCEQRDVVEAYGLGAHSYGWKPVSSAEFGDAIRRVGLSWILLSHLSHDGFASSPASSTPPLR